MQRIQTNSSQIIAFPLSGFTTGWFEALLYQKNLHEAVMVNSKAYQVATSSSIFQQFSRDTP